MNFCNQIIEERVPFKSGAVPFGFVAWRGDAAGGLAEFAPVRELFWGLPSKSVSVRSTLAPPVLLSQPGRSGGGEVVALC